MNQTISNICLYCYAPINPAPTWGDVFFLKAEERLCAACAAKLEPIKGLRCDCCGRPLEKKGVCSDCEQWRRHADYGDVLLFNQSLYVYNKFLKEMMAKFKYRGDYELARIFAIPLKKITKLDVDYIVPIPLSEERLMERGFNQAAAIGLCAGLTLTNGLVRLHSEKQAKKTRAERLHARQIFTPHPAAPSFHEKRILLLDDVYTTGTTIRHAAHVLKVIGAKDVFSVTIAR